MIKHIRENAQIFTISSILLINLVLWIPLIIYGYNHDGWLNPRNRMWLPTMPLFITLFAVFNIMILKIWTCIQIHLNIKLRYIVFIIGFLQFLVIIYIYTTSELITITPYIYCAFCNFIVLLHDSILVVHSLLVIS
jgi:hypothetical protein